MLALLALAFGLLLVGPLATPAQAQEEEKSFELPRARVVADIMPDGSVLVTEDITYDFSGSFEGGYRKIPLEDGVSVNDVSVSEGGKGYAPGASAGLGSSDTPGTYGTAKVGDEYWIVWHYRATDEQRTFTLRYHLEDLAVAYDDVVDLYWQPWGDDWGEPLGTLQAEVLLPGESEKGDVKVFGHPASVSGVTNLGQGGISPRLVAVEVPARQFVEMRVVFPRELLASSGGARVEAGDGLEKIMDQEAAEARSEARSEEREALQQRQQSLRALFALLLIVGFGGAVLTLGFLAWWFGLPGGGRYYGGGGRYDGGGGGGFSGGGGDGGGGGGGGAW